MMRQLKLQPAQYYNKVYSVRVGRLGVGDTAVLISQLAVPLILPGELNNWEFYDISGGEKLLAASSDYGVFVIDYVSATFQKWTKHYIEREIKGRTMTFVCTGHPIEGSVPARAWVDSMTGQLTFADEGNIGSVRTSMAEHHQLNLIDL